MAERRAPLHEIYPKEFQILFTDLSLVVEDFLRKYEAETASLSSSPEKMAEYSQALQQVVSVIADGLRAVAQSPAEDHGTLQRLNTYIREKKLSVGELAKAVSERTLPSELSAFSSNEANARMILDTLKVYLQATQLAREHGKVSAGEFSRTGILPGKHRYHILERVVSAAPRIPKEARSLLLMLQRLPFGTDTEPEVHGMEPGGDSGELVPAPYGGIEVYLPLVDGIEFHVNDQVFHPKALQELITILPGDNHHHAKKEGKGPARVLIAGGFGFSRGIKIGRNFTREKFNQIPRNTAL